MWISLEQMAEFWIVTKKKSVEFCTLQFIKLQIMTANDNRQLIYNVNMSVWIMFLMW